MVLCKCQLLTKAEQVSSKIADLLESLNKNIKKMNLAWWNSEYLLVKSAFSVGKPDLESIAIIMENCSRFSSNDLIVLEQIFTILEPFYEISIRCQVNSAVSASLVLPLISPLLCHLSEMKLVGQLQVPIETRFTTIMNRLHQRTVREDGSCNDALSLMTPLFDPQFKFYWIRDMKFPAYAENHFKQTIVQLIIDEISKCLNTASARWPSESSQSSATAPAFSYSTIG